MNTFAFWLYFTSECFSSRHEQKELSHTTVLASFCERVGGAH